MRKVFKLLCVALLLPSLSLVGCKKKKSSVTKPGVTGTASSSSDTKEESGGSDDEYEARVAKQQKYVAVLNGTRETYKHVLKQYMSWCDGECVKTGPTGKEKYMNRGVTDITNDPKSGVETMRKTAKESPSIPDMDQAALKYADAIEKLYPVIRAASLYYKHEDYKTDGFAKAKEFHKVLMEQGQVFTDALSAVNDGVDKIEDEMTKRELATLDKQSLHYMMVEYLFISKELMNLLNNVEWDAAPSDPAIQKAIQQANLIISKWKALDTIFTMNEQKIKDELEGSSHYWDLNKPVNGMKDVVKSLIERLEKPAKGRFTEYEIKEINEGSDNVRGTGNAVAAGYSELIDGYNKLRFKK